MKDEWDFEAIELPAGCWVHSKNGDLMLPGGAVVGKLSEDGLRALVWHLEDLSAGDEHFLLHGSPPQ
jgi:hypothetical protein